MAKVTPFACAAALAQAWAWGERAKKAMGDNDAETKKMPGVREGFLSKEHKSEILLRGLFQNGKKEPSKWVQDEKMPGMRESFPGEK